MAEERDAAVHADVRPELREKPRLVDRALRLVGDVRPGEGRSALVLGATLFSLLAAYYLLKVARETLVLSRYDAEVKVYVAAAQIVVLAPAVSAYAWLSDRVDRFRLVASVTVFFALNLVVFAVLYGFGVPIGIPFYVWVGVFNVFVIAQLWAFANDVYDEARGRRLFAVIGLGGSLGAIAGSYGASGVGELVGTGGLLVLPIVLLLATILGAWWVHAHPSARAEEPAPKRTRRGALSLLVSDRWLVLIALMMLLLNCENTLGEYVLDRVMQADIRAGLSHVSRELVDGLVETRTRDFKSSYFGAFSTLGFVLQLLVTGRVMQRGGAAISVLVLPIVALVGQVGMIVSGVAFAVALTSKVAENSVDYSVQSTGRNALFLVTSGETKYKVKVFIDSVVVRLGDVVAGGLVVGLASVLHSPPIVFTCVGALLAVSWLVIAVFVGREHDRRARLAAAEAP
jgi:AAA family ATP:ADP antiporter